MPKQNGTTVINETVDATRRVAEETTAAARQTAEHGMTMSREFVEAWSNSAEITLKAAFDLQHAAMKAGQSLIEATDNTTRIGFQQWAAMVRHAQEATLEAWQASRRIGEEFRANVKPEGPTGH